MRISNAAQLPKSGADDPSQGSEQLTVGHHHMMEVIQLFLLLQKRQRPDALPVSPVLMGHMPACALHEAWDRTGPRNHGVPVRLTPQAQQGKVKPPGLKLEQHDTTTFYTSRSAEKGTKSGAKM